MPAPSITESPGKVLPCANERIRFTLPATRPLMRAICTGSAADSLRVKLLSMPQARHAPAIAKAPQPKLNSPPSPDQDSKTAPAKIANAPNSKRRSTIFPEDQPGDGHCGQTFKVEQKRAGRS